jgi:predicted dehydrogenase
MSRAFEKIRIVVVGLGSAGRRHAANLMTLGVKEVIPCSEWRQLKEIELGGRTLQVVPDYEQALNSRPDAVCLANPTSMHASYLAKAVDRGCSVYVEKPVASSSHGMESLKEQIARSNVVVAVGNQLRFNSCLEHLRRVLSDNVIGRILHVHADMGEYLPNYHPQEDYRSSYAARETLGGGVLLTQIHDINYLHWLFGSFETVYAVEGRRSDLQIDVEDSVSFLLKNSDIAISGHVDFLQRVPRRILTITGEFGTIGWDYNSNTLKLSNADGERELGNGQPLDRNAMFLEAMSDFLSCCGSTRTPRTDFASGLMDVAVVDAIRESSKTNKAAAISYDIS